MKEKNKTIAARLENFEEVKAYYQEQGYTYQKVNINIVLANIVSVLILSVAAVVCFYTFFMVYEEIVFSFTTMMGLLFIAFVLIVVHEALHGLGWSFFCKKKWKSIQFGVLWKYLTPYCCCLEPLSWKPYLFGGLLPFLVLGVGFYFIAMLSGNFAWLLLAILNIGGAGGDLMVAYHIVKDRPSLLMDLPEECGYLAFYKD